MIIQKAIAAFLASFLLSCTSVAGPSTQHLGAASTHASIATAHGASAVIKGVAVVAAVPLLIVAGTGAVSGAAGSALTEFASEPLPIGNEVLHETPDPATVLGQGKQ